MASSSHQAKVDALDADPYELLGLDADADCGEAEAVRAYRRMARRWHPDKNPDRKEYAEKMFHKLTAALQILTDAGAKAALDRMRRARAARQKAVRRMDAKRAKYVDELLQRERQCADKANGRGAGDNGGGSGDDEAAASKQFEQEVERLRKEGSRLVEAEGGRLRDEMERSRREEAATSARQQQAPAAFRIRVKWQSAGDYDKHSLEAMFHKYGAVNAVAVGAKKKSAIVEFAHRISAENAVSLERGVDGAVLTLGWLAPPPPAERTCAGGGGQSAGGQQQQRQSAPSSTARRVAPPAGGYSADFESAVLRNMRVAHERQRLIDNMRSAEAADGGCDTAATVLTLD